VDCAVSWGEWGECSGGSRQRTEVVTTEAVGAGASCPELRTESEGETMLLHGACSSSVV